VSILKGNDEPIGVIRSLIANMVDGQPSPQRRGWKTALIALGGLAGVTAASAGISSLRRREEQAKDSS
jgi:hypothetical protein